MRVTHRPWARLALLGAFALAPLSLTGCAGFTPLYTQNVTGNMSQIAITAPQTRTGYFLEQDLRNGFGADDSTTKLYKLEVTMSERHYAIGYRVDDTSTRSEITNHVAYTLRDATTLKLMTSNQFSETVTYDTSQSPFTGVVSQQDAQVRIATAISQKIQTDLAIYFHSPPPPPVTPAPVTPAPASPTQ